MTVAEAICSSTTSRPLLHLRSADGICTRMLSHHCSFDAQDRRQKFGYGAPVLTFVVGAIKLAPTRTEIEPDRIQGVCRERITQDGEKAIAVGQAFTQRFP